MDISNQKNEIINFFRLLPHKDNLNFFILYNLKDFTGCILELTEVDRRKAITYKLEMSEEEWETFDKEYYEKYPKEESNFITLTNNKSIVQQVEGVYILSEMTSKILNDCYFEYSAIKAKDLFLEMLSNFDVNFSQKNFLQTIALYEKLMNEEIKVSSDVNLRGKALNYENFYDTARQIQLEIIQYIQSRFNELNDLSYLKEINIDGIKLFDGMTYLTFMNTQKYINIISKDFSGVSYLYQRLKKGKLINAKKQMEFADWLLKSELIKPYLYDQISSNNGFKTLSRSAPKTNEIIYNEIF